MVDLRKIICKQVGCTRYLWEDDSSPTALADYLRGIAIPAWDYYQKRCDTLGLITMPQLFPVRWTYSDRYVPVSDSRLFDSPVRGSIPVLGGPEASALAKDEEESDRRHFWNMLVATMPRVASYLPIRRANDVTPERELTILDVGCGRGLDAIPLTSYFGDTPYGVPGRNVSYIGVDVDIVGLKNARGIHKDRPDLRFEQADATRFDDYPFLRGKFDIVVIRHPEVFTRHSRRISDTWLHIFRESVAHLAEGGILLVTAYRCMEHLGAERALTSYGARRVFAGHNPFSANISFYGGVDRRDQYVTIYTRGDVEAIAKRDKKLRISCGEEAAEVKGGGTSAGNEMVTGHMPDGTMYEVTSEQDGSVIVYREPKAGRVKRILLDERGAGKVSHLATDGANIFVLLKEGGLNNMSMSDRDRQSIDDQNSGFYKIDWEGARLILMSAVKAADFSIISRTHFSSASVIHRGFCIADGYLLAESLVSRDGGDRLYYHHYLEDESEACYPVKMQITNNAPHGNANTWTGKIRRLFSPVVSYFTDF